MTTVFGCPKRRLGKLGYYVDRETIPACSRVVGQLETAGEPFIFRRNAEQSRDDGLVRTVASIRRGERAVKNERSLRRGVSRTFFEPGTRSELLRPYGNSTDLS